MSSDTRSIPKRKPSAIFLDWGKTLTNQHYWKGAIKTEIFDAIQRRLFKENDPLVFQWMRGEVSANAICGWLGHELDIPRETIEHALERSAANMHLPPPLRAVIARTRRICPVALVTDNMDVFSSHTVPETQLGSVFTKIYNSAPLKRLKKDEDGKTFVDACVELNVSINDAVFIDDHGPNCILFRRLGGTAYDTLDAEETQEILEDIIQRHG